MLKIQGNTLDIDFDMVLCLVLILIMEVEEGHFQIKHGRRWKK
jgi:hypothetical protein